MREEFLNRQTQKGNISAQNRGPSLGGFQNNQGGPFNAASNDRFAFPSAKVTDPGNEAAPGADLSYNEGAHMDSEGVRVPVLKNIGL